MTVERDREDWLEPLLEKDPYVADDGFTARVVGALPKDGANRRRRLVLMLSCVVGLLVPLVILPGGRALGLVGDRAAALLAELRFGADVFVAAVGQQVTASLVYVAVFASLVLIAGMVAAFAD